MCDVRLSLRLLTVERSVYSRARPAGSLNFPRLFLELVPCYRVYDIYDTCFPDSRRPYRTHRHRSTMRREVSPRSAGQRGVAAWRALRRAECARHTDSILYEPHLRACGPCSRPTLDVSLFTTVRVCHVTCAQMHVRGTSIPTHALAPAMGSRNKARR